MAENVEIKAWTRDWDGAHHVAKVLSGDGGKRIQQTDTFFRVPKGRLKLRCCNSSDWEIIWYFRPDTSGAKLSAYWRLKIHWPGFCTGILRTLFTIRGTIRKERTLFLLRDARIHLDSVESLGRFIEFEILLKRVGSISKAHERADVLSKLFQIQDGDLVSTAYMDLLEADDSEGGVRRLESNHSFL